MKHALPILALASINLASAAAADKRIQTIVYDAEEIVQIVGRAGIQSTVEFGPEERIENVAVGDSAAWQITPNRRASLLFLKPLVRATRTNMTVVTDRRVYMFDLVPAGKADSPLYALKFVYPDERPAASQPQMQMAAAPTAQGPVVPEQLNFGWKVKGSGRLRPRRIFDDGKALYLAWDRDVSLPAILSLSNERVEGPLNYRVSGDFIIVEPMPSSILLRQGKKTATIWAARPILRPATPPSVAPLRPAPIAMSPQTPARVKASASVRMPDVTRLYTSKLAGAGDAQ